MKKNDWDVSRSHSPLPRKDGGVVCGRNAVTELLLSERCVEKIYLQRDGVGSLKRIQSLAKEKKIPIALADKAKLTLLSGGTVHQGVVAMAGQKEYADLDTLFAIAESRG
ncbi:MAG: hypothetical protein IKC69_00975, partial [Clostridia bacterium]|nr:hypothetical protein [Clostridia bacterium]